MRPRDEQCPKRGPGLTHIVDGGVTCVHCGDMTYLSAGDWLKQLRDAVVKAEDIDPPGPEGPQPGYCEVGRTHFARDGVYFMPRYGKWACLRHLKTILDDAIKRGEWGKR